mgnify:CR=1 FL=1
MKKSKKGQITIFVIIALIIVVAIALFFALKQVSISPGGGGIFGGPLSGQQTQTYIEDCAKKATSEILPEMYLKAGFINPSPFFIYDGEKIGYLCYTPFKNQLCINKHPVLNKEVEKVITDYITPKIQKCFSDIKEQLRDSDFRDSPAIDINVFVEDKKIAVKIKKDIAYTFNDNSVQLSIFNTEVDSAFFDFIKLSSQIIDEELDCDCEKESCNADITRLNKNNREFEITKPVYTSEGIEIYNIKEILTQNEFKFAVANCIRA